MKIVVIGDIHGHSSWEKIIEKEKDFDLVIFLGDYWDSFTMTQEQQRDNYIKIQQFRESNKDKVITLLGNHDYHYIYGSQYSGWKLATYYMGGPILKEDFKDGKLKFAYKYEDILFSHAGITKYWLEGVGNCTLEELLKNEVNLRLFDWNSKIGYSAYGDTISNSPIWVRPNSLLENKLDNFKQVVGHTSFKKIIEKDNVWFCDTLPDEYLVIEDDNFIIKKL